MTSWMYTPLCILSMLHVASSGFYDDASHVTVLDVTTFYRTVTHQQPVWMVEFYATWCGHCQRFKTTWLQLADDVQGWGTVLRIGAVDCSRQRNNVLCRDQQVMGYPSVKFYPPGWQRTLPPQPYPRASSADVTALRHTAIDVILRHAHAWRLLSWPPLTIQHTDIRDVWTGVSDNEHRRAQRCVIEENTANTSNYTSREIMLDLSTLYPDRLIVHRVVRNSPMTSPEELTVWHVTRNGNPLLLIRSSNRSEIVQRVMSHYTDETNNPAASDQQLSDSADSEAAHGTTESTDMHQSSEQIPDGVYQDDLESAVYYSLWNEIGSREMFTAQENEAIKNYVRILAEYLPGPPRITRFLSQLHNFIGRRNRIRGAFWRRLLVHITTNDTYISSAPSWVSCRPSDPSSSLRQYPCGLWLVFHSLTVNAYLKDGHYADFRPHDVLVTIREYVRHFFGCRSCAEHFVSMATTIEADVMSNQSRDEVIAWLWRAHNHVNLRLAGAVTEDPGHPKVVFPTPAQCAPCYDADSEQQNTGSPADNGTSGAAGLPPYQGAVHQYMIERYRRENIIYYSELPQETELQDARSMDTPHPPHNTSQSAACSGYHSDWSPCSVSCGQGTSTRMRSTGATHNHRCVLTIETRLCHVRDCDRPMTSLDCHRPSYTRPSQPISYSSCWSAPPSSGSRDTLCVVDCLSSAYNDRLCCSPDEVDTEYIDLLCDDSRHVLRMPRAVVRSCTCTSC